MPQTAPVVIPAAPVMDEATLTKLATEIATDRRELLDVLKDYHLTETVYTNEVLPNPYFQTALSALVKEWNGANNTKNRIGFKAASIIEETLLILAKRIAKPDEGLAAVVETVKFLKSLTNLGDEEKTPVGAGEKFIINISLAGDTITKTVEAPGTTALGVSPVQIDGKVERKQPQVQSLPEGESEAVPVRPLT